MRVFITQSNYIPWRGYFHAIDRADVLVLYDHAQYTKRDWRNRNRIKTATGTRWLTIPVKVKNLSEQAIEDTRVVDGTWARGHLESIRQAYRAAPHYRDVLPVLEETYALAAGHTHLSAINAEFLDGLCRWLAIDTPMRWSREFDLRAGRTERLLGICLDLGATTYLSGPAARNYLDISVFERAGVEVEFLDYSYEPYPQLHGAFEPSVSIVDTMMQLGPGTRDALLPVARSRDDVCADEVPR
ncbi:MAG: WbqC family protein [Actinomycetota bacterium]